MEAVVLGTDDTARWESLTTEAGAFALTQSAGWGSVKRELGWEPFRVAVDDGGVYVAGALMLVKQLPLGAGSVAYVPRGPIGDWLNPPVAKTLFDALGQIARSNRAIFLKVEPADSDAATVRETLSALGFKSSASSNQPLATVIVDISADEETILRSMRDSTRRKIKSAEKKGVVVRRGTPDDLDTFYELMRETSERTGTTLRAPEYYRTEFETFYANDQALLLFGEHEGTALAAHVAYACGPHAAFFHQASSSARSNLNPNCLLVWEQIKWAKGKGCRTHDLWGIPDEVGAILAEGLEIPNDRTDGLWGVFRFKAGFSKDIVSYPGSFDVVYSPTMYAVATSKLVSGALEKISSSLDARR
jgi:lipid II:glycine glycyltransferase (peptidoglycan interpeptide bridge formation enzyme)